MIGTLVTSLALMMPMQQSDAMFITAGGDTLPKQVYAVPEVKISGVDGPIEYGELVILSAEYDAEHLPLDLKNLSFNWTVLDEGKPKKVFMADGGKQIAFAGGMRARKIVVILDVNCDFQTTEKVKVLGADGKPVDKTVIVDAKAVSPNPIFSEIVVGTGPTPTPDPIIPPSPPLPNPGPSPTPPPAPVIPDSPLGLTKFVYELFTAAPSLGDNPIKLVDPSTKVEKTYANGKVLLATKLAEGLEGIAGQIAGLATYRDVSTILADTTKANKAAFASLPIDLTKTASLKDGINAKMKELWDASKINTAEDIGSAWRELAQGLRLVR